MLCCLSSFYLSGCGCLFLTRDTCSLTSSAEIHGHEMQVFSFFGSNQHIVSHFNTSVVFCLANMIVIICLCQCVRQDLFLQSFGLFSLFFNFINNGRCLDLRMQQD